MVRDARNIVDDVVTEAIRLGAGGVEVEYKDGYEQVFATQGNFGYGIASFRSSSPKAVALRKELYRLAKRKRRVAVDGIEYELRCAVFDSFGEDAFGWRCGGS
jgi:hypothetical protein